MHQTPANLPDLPDGGSRLALIHPGALLLLSFVLGACVDHTSDSPSATPPTAEVATQSGEAALPAAPVAERRPHAVSSPHGAMREDEYYWLRDDSRKDSDVLAYLDAENRYADALMKPLSKLREHLFQDLVGRIKQDDASVPYRDGDYWYYTRYEEGREHPIYARRRGSMEANEEIMLDVNLLAEGHAFFKVASWEVSPDQTRLLYTEDTVGRRQYTLRVKDLGTGAMLPDRIEGVSDDAVWGNDSASVFYLQNDPTTLLARRVKHHVFGSPPAKDALVYEELDNSFNLGIYRTRSEAFICIDVESTVSSETRCAPADEPKDFRVLAGRERDFEYQADHLNGRWVIRSNADAPNFRLMQADSEEVFERNRWRELVPHDSAVFIHGFQLFDGFMAIDEQSEGLSRLRVVPAGGPAMHVEADEPAYLMRMNGNAAPDTDWLRYTYESMATPPTTFELNTVTGERRQLKQDTVLGGFDQDDYVVERLSARSRDGVDVPISLVYRKGLQKDGTAALWQHGYGSYGSNAEPGFSPAAINLLERGVVYAIAHVRGGQELGRQWYEQGRLANKMNTFNDFIDVTDHLVDLGYAAKGRVAASGRSAGGLLMGAIANMAPDRYRVIVTQVPFVDVVTTMLDETIPLTTNEFDEWGNPAQPEAYQTMLAYSPYDQLKAQDYPAMYISTGLWDSQVQYFEPAKYVARMRALKTDSRPLVFRIDMEAGHGGKSGRLERYREVADGQAFALTQLGITEAAGKR